MSNTENIEAKLCAYVEGQLDAGQRAEIEKHLEANPQHRKLIAELSQTREMLGALPREAAPQELLETLQGQLERSVLLSDIDEETSTAAMRISRWPQVFAAAAIVLITIGLGSFIYVMLPANDPFAFTTPGDPPPIAPGTAPSMAGKAAGDADSEPTELALAETELDAPQSPPLSAAQPLVQDSGTLAMKNSLNASTDEPERQSDAFAMTPSVLGESADQSQASRRELFDADELAQQVQGANVTDNAMFVVVSSDTPIVACAQATDYFLRNNIQWQAVSEPMPEPLKIAENQTAMMYKQQRVDVRMKLPLDELRNEMLDFSLAQAAPTTHDSEPRDAGSQRSHAYAVGRSTELTQSEDLVNEPNGPNRLQAQQQELTLETGGQPLQRQDLWSHDQQTQAAAAPRRGRQESFFSATPADKTNRLIIARSMTRQQVAELNTTLSRFGTLEQGSIDTKSLVPSATQPTTAPSQSASPFSTPMLPAQAASIPAMRALNGVVANDATTQPSALAAEEAPLENRGLTTRPTTQPLAAIELEERLDVVIVVQDQPRSAQITDSSALGSPTTRPSTHPTNAGDISP